MSDGPSSRGMPDVEPPPGWRLQRRAERRWWVFDATGTFVADLILLPTTGEWAVVHTGDALPSATTHRDPQAAVDALAGG